MLHFNFNQLGLCMFDHYKFMDTTTIPNTVPIGEVVTIGRDKRHKAIFIPSVKDDDLAISYCDQFETPTDILYLSKLIQYIPAIKGYLFAYTSAY